MIIHHIPADKTLLEGKDDSFVEYSDPSTWSWEYPVGLKVVNELHFAADYSQDNKSAQYGLFLDKKLTQPVSAMSVDFCDGSQFGIKELPVISMIVTKEEYRGKGYGKALYETVLNRHQGIISDEELFTDEGKTNKSLGMWVNHLTKLGNVVNIDISSQEITPFNLQEATSQKEIRFMVLKEGVLGKVGRFAAGALATASLAHGATADKIQEPSQQQNFKTYYQSQDDDSKINDFKQMLMKHEGVSDKVYTDTTGHKSIGVGFNLERSDAPEILKSVGANYSDVISGKEKLNQDQINKLFNFSIKEAVRDARQVFKNIDSMPTEAKFVALDLTFNMGKAGIKKFHGFINAMNAGDWNTAADELMYKDGKTKSEYSQWWTQITNGHNDFETVKNKNPDNRAIELISLLKNLSPEI